MTQNSTTPGHGNYSCLCQFLQAVLEWICCSYSEWETVLRLLHDPLPGTQMHSGWSIKHFSETLSCLGSFTAPALTPAPGHTGEKCALDCICWKEYVVYCPPPLRRELQNRNSAVMKTKFNKQIINHNFYQPKFTRKSVLMEGIRRRRYQRFDFEAYNSLT